MERRSAKSRPVLSRLRPTVDLALIPLKHEAQTKPEDQGPLKLTTLAPQVSYSKPKRPN